MPQLLGPIPTKSQLSKIDIQRESIYYSHYGGIHTWQKALINSGLKIQNREPGPV